MATGVNREKMQLTAFDDASPKTPYRRKNLTKSLTQAELKPILFQISLPWQRGSVRENAIGSIRWSIPGNSPMGAKISQKSLMQAELKPILFQISLPWQRGSVGEKCN